MSTKRPLALASGTLRELTAVDTLDPAALGTGTPAEGAKLTAHGAGVSATWEPDSSSGGGMSVGLNLALASKWNL